MTTFNADDYSDLPVPADTTLGVCKEFMKARFLGNQGPITLDQARRLLSEKKNKSVTDVDFSVRFVYHQEEGMPIVDCPDDMTLGEFRRLTPSGRVIVDIGEGGAKVSPKVPELV
jgi:hypothetical protein